jgi:hypothetical protein
MSRGRKVTFNGIVFDSQIEGQRYLQLLSMEQTGDISHLVCHPKFELQPSFKHHGKTIRAITYTADFQYTDLANGDVIVEDVKGRNNRAKRSNTAFIPPAGRLRIKLFKYKFPTLKFIIKVM